MDLGQTRHYWSSRKSGTGPRSSCLMSASSKERVWEGGKEQARRPVVAFLCRFVWLAREAPVEAAIGGGRQGDGRDGRRAGDSVDDAKRCRKIRRAACLRARRVQRLPGHSQRRWAGITGWLRRAHCTQPCLRLLMGHGGAVYLL